MYVNMYVENGGKEEGVHVFRGVFAFICKKLEYGKQIVFLSMYGK